MSCFRVAYQSQLPNYGREAKRDDIRSVASSSDGQHLYKLIAKIFGEAVLRPYLQRPWAIPSLSPYTTGRQPLR